MLLRSADPRQIPLRCGPRAHKARARSNRVALKPYGSRWPWRRRRERLVELCAWVSERLLRWHHSGRQGNCPCGEFVQWSPRGKALAEQRRSSAYLGPDKDRWTPKAWSDVVDAAAGGLLDETHWVDLKQELPAGKRRHNTDLAIDLASLAVDGGMLVIGMEDDDGRAGNVCGVELAGLEDRVDDVARGKVRPPLVVHPREIPDPDRPGWGCLLVHVPPSGLAPHMVDHVYYGRGHRANIRLGDEQVRAILDQRSRGRADVVAELQRMADRDPLSAEQRQFGHLYVLAQPEIAIDEALVELLAGSDTVRVIHQMLKDIDRDRPWKGFPLDVLELGLQNRRAEGLAIASYSPHDGLPPEQRLLELVVREDGGIRLTCGRGTEPSPGGWPVSGKPTMAMLVIRVLGLAYAVAALAGRLGDQYAAYQGQWRIGLRIDRLRGVVPVDRVAGGSFGPGNPYTDEEYERITSASTDELIDAPQLVVEHLVAPLLRGLGIESRYLPYKP
jgi:hypothetical protein